jgi:hypothetical protein
MRTPGAVPHAEGRGRGATGPKIPWDGRLGLREAFEPLVSQGTGPVVVIPSSTVAGSETGLEG